MDLTISIPDELLPGLVAIANAESTAEQPLTPEDVAQRYAESAARKACQDLGVGPYWPGITYPQFSADGSPFVPPVPEPAAAEDTLAGGVASGEA